jgi:hypothetical protein
MSVEAIKRKVGIGATAASATLIVSGSVQVSAATFRSPTTDSPVWRREGELLGATALAVFERAGLSGDAGITALRILRSIVRGFVMHEMGSSFLDGVDYDATYAITLRVFIRGLDEIRTG